MKRATKPFDYVYEQIFISIHALMKRATISDNAITSEQELFQSTPS